MLARQCSDRAVRVFDEFSHERAWTPWPSTGAPAADGQATRHAPGHQLLETANGDLDCLGSIDDGKSYDELIASTVPIKLSGDLTIRVLDLATLIEIKKRAGRPKDLAALPHLEATLRESRKL